MPLMVMGYVAGRPAAVVKLNVDTLVIDRQGPEMNTYGLEGDYLIVEESDCYTLPEPELVKSFVPFQAEMMRGVFE